MELLPVNSFFTCRSFFLLLRHSRSKVRVFLPTTLFFSHELLLPIHTSKYNHLCHDQQLNSGEEKKAELPWKKLNKD